MRFLVPVAVLSLFQTAFARVPTVDEFDAALVEHHKSLGIEFSPSPRQSKAIRQQALEKSAAVIDEHNANPKRTYSMKWNEMSDFTEDEYLALLYTKPDEVLIPHHRWRQEDVRSLADVPKSIDWSTKDGGKYTTPVKNQGTCGSCWAFTGAAVIETMVAIQSNTQAIALSVEQILSCTGSLQHIQSKYPNRMVSSAKGCDGGMTFLAFEYLARNDPHGLTCNAKMPYRMKLTTDAYDASRCSAINVSAAWDASTSKYLSIQNDEAAIISALQNGPVSVAIDASSAGFRHYGSGIYDATDCKSDGSTVDHAVNVVGYGETDDGQAYWIIRNSWGSMWGERGYMRMARGTIKSASGPCNLFLYATQPLGLKNVPQAGCASTATPVTAADSSLPATAVWPRNLEQGSLIYGVSMAIALLGIALHFYGEHRLQVNFPKQTYVESFMRNQLPTQSQVLMHVAQRKAKEAVNSV
ncbi:hypothetical protein AC1031_009782 [Aphanomyces cochlioides]|nr:hypothetical protein AC1031_009782 [Aphanomyces cochlioides]